jgi:hypothetical protein
MVRSRIHNGNHWWCQVDYNLIWIDCNKLIVMFGSQGIVIPKLGDPLVYTSVCGLYVDTDYWVSQPCRTYEIGLHLWSIQ